MFLVTAPAAPASRASSEALLHVQVMRSDMRTAAPTTPATAQQAPGVGGRGRRARTQQGAPAGARPRRSAAQGLGMV